MGLYEWFDKADRLLWDKHISVSGVRVRGVDYERVDSLPIAIHVHVNNDENES